MPSAQENLARIRDLRPKTFPLSAVSELALRRASQSGYIHYLPGDPDFKILNREGMTGKQWEALERIREGILKPFQGTGVQGILNYAVFEELKQIAVYPVANHERLTDRSGNILPDTFLIPSGSLVKDLAEKIHTDLAKNLLFAIDARSKMRMGPSHPLKHKDVLQIVSAVKR
jgi:ribosome-binding ATPase YchF (GTP1/OBG family)